MGTDFLAGPVTTGHGVMILKWRRLDIRKKVFYTECGKTLAQVAQGWWLPHPWKCPRAGWMGLKAS